MKIAVLQAGCAPASLISGHGDYDDMSKRFLGLSGDHVPTFRAFEKDLPQAVNAFDLYIVTGSPSGVYEDHAWIKGLQAFLRQAFDQKKKIIGLCFGHQILAQAMGGTVVKSDKGYGIGVMDYTLGVTSDHTEPVSLCAWHQDQVIKAPEGTKIILSSEFCPIAGLQYGHQAISFQPHPEFTKAFVGDLITVREGETISHDLADAARTSLEKDVSPDKIAQLLEDALGL